MKERTTPRGAPRLSVALKGTLHPEDGARAIPVVTLDLGAGGAQCSVSDPLRVGTRGLLRLALPSAAGADQPIEMRCTVVRVDGAGPAEIALAFEASRSADLESLKRFLVRARTQPGR